MINTLPPWTIDGLSAQVAMALAVGYDGSPNGRIRDVPDLRTIRYYTTLGLLDRPAEMHGRTALYGRRHLLQLVAIKRLQARGLKLAQIQHQLLGLPDSALEPLAQLPATDGSGSVEASRAREPERDAAFWKTAPAVPEPPFAATPLEVAVAAPEASSAVLQGVPLGDAVTLLLATERSLNTDDVTAIRTVAAPLLELLHARRLLAPRQKGTHDDQSALADDR